MANSSTANQQPYKSVNSRVAWGAIFAGALVALALFLILGSLWAALELTFASRSGGFTPAGVFILSLVAMFAGGWTTAHLCAGESVGEAMFFGVILWSVTAIFLLYLAINGILVLGSATLLGQASSHNDEFGIITNGAAWWGFSGVILSLLATMGGVIAGFPRRNREERRAAARRLREHESADRLPPGTEPLPH